mgnify:CR=1 FL=1
MKDISTSEKLHEQIQAAKLVYRSRTSPQCLTTEQLMARESRKKPMFRYWASMAAAAATILFVIMISVDQGPGTPANPTPVAHAPLENAPQYPSMSVSGVHQQIRNYKQQNFEPGSISRTTRQMSLSGSGFAESNLPSISSINSKIKSLRKEQQHDKGIS